MSTSDIEIEIIADDSETQNLINQFNSLSLVHRKIPNGINSKIILNSISQTSMTTRSTSNVTFEKAEINLLVNAIPEYHPGENLSIFINEVDNLLEHLQGRLTPDLAYLLQFSIGILKPYRSYLSHFDLTTVEECLNKCRLYDNRKQEWDYCEFLRRSQDDPKTATMQTYPTPNNRPNPQPQHYSTNRRFQMTQPSAQPRPFQGPINKPIG